MDKKDMILSVSAGSITAAMDFLWSDDIDLDDARNWGKDKTESVLLKIATKTGYKGNSFEGAVAFLNYSANNQSDCLNPANAYIREQHDFSEDLGFKGLVLSIFENCTNLAFGTDENGDFQIRDLQELRSVRSNNILEAVYFGAVGWLLRVASAKKGYGLSEEEGIAGFTGPFKGFLNELCSMEGFGSDLEQLFMEAGIDFDFHMELGISAEMIKKKRFVPVLIYEAIVSSFYSARKLMQELKVRKENKIVNDPIDFKRILPWKSDELTAMRKLTALSFTAVDFSSNGVKAAFKHKGDKTAFVKELLQGVNYCGLGRLLSLAKDDILEKLESLSGFYAGMQEQIQENYEQGVAGFFESQEESVWDEGADSPESEEKYGVVNSNESAFINADVLQNYLSGMPMSYLEAVQIVYDELATAFAECIQAHEERLRIEAECREAILLLRQNRAQMEQVVEEYMNSHLDLFVETVDKMEEALQKGNTDAFLGSNAVLQESLGMEVQFTTQAEFEDFMDSDLDFDL